MALYSLSAAVAFCAVRWFHFTAFPSGVIESAARLTLSHQYRLCEFSFRWNAPWLSSEEMFQSECLIIVITRCHVSHRGRKRAHVRTDRWAQFKTITKIQLPCCVIISGAPKRRLCLHDSASAWPPRVSLAVIKKADSSDQTLIQQKAFSGCGWFFFFLLVPELLFSLKCSFAN